MSWDGDAEQIRTVTWQDPLLSSTAARQMDGLTFLRTMLEGGLPMPPIMRLIGITMVSVEEGRVVFGLEPQEFHYNPIGSVHGGVACTMLDSAMGCAVHSVLPAGSGYTTVELTATLVRPITLDTGRLRCEGSTIHVGGRMATAEGRLTDLNGKLYAHGTTVCMLFRPGTDQVAEGKVEVS